MTPHDAPQATKFGDTIALLIVDGNPPTIDYQRAHDALRATPGIDKVWITPYAQAGANHQHVREMCSMAAIEMQAGLCTIALDKNLMAIEDILKESQRLFPYFSFKHASLQFRDCDYFVKFGSHAVSSSTKPEAKSAQVVVVNCLESMPEIRQMIKAGKDVSRCFQPPVWHYIQKKGLYR